MGNHCWWMFLDHEWKAKAVYCRAEPIYNEPNYTKPRTDILYVCSCGKVKTKTVQGTWKLEAVQP